MNQNLPNFDELWDYDQPAETEQKFRVLMPAFSQSNNKGPYLELLTQIARTLGLQRDFEAAHTLLDQVESHLTADLERARLRYLLERGRTYNSSGQKEKATPLFMEAWEQGQTAGEDFYAVDAAHMVAIAETGEKVLAWNLKALQAAEASSDKRAQGWRGSLYNNIGWTYHDMKDYAAALDMFEKAHAFQQEQGKAEPIRIAQWCIARVMRSLGQVDEALKSQQELLAAYTTLGEESGYTEEELGECLLLLDRPTEAKLHFANAYRLLSQDQWLVANEAERLKRLKRLSL